MNFKALIFSALCVSLSTIVSAGFSSDTRSPFAACRGKATYAVTFTNFLTPKRFGSLIPENGLVYSPLTATGHSNRVSILTVRGFASKAIEAVAETGDNSMLIEALKGLREAGYVRSYAASTGPTMPGKSTTLRVRVDCKRPFISAVSMIAPSPDWIVQINNVNTVRGRGFIRRRSGMLIAYDAGVDDGREFTNPADTSLDLPTMPPKNIAPLVEDETDRFRGRVVGFYRIRRVFPRIPSKKPRKY